MIKLSPEKMTTAEKLSAMEILWNDLCQHSTLESPEWHQAVLDLREQQRIAGDQPAMDWEAAKIQIRKQIT